jgi:crossover junction endodeoxyribonuclease RusA
MTAIFVPGRPAPQGSKMARPIYKGRGAAKQFTGKVAQVESSKPGLETWRADVRAAFLYCGNPIVRFADGQPVSVRLTFVMPRPSGMPKRKPTPPHTKRPDVDKLLRAVLDALTSAGVLHDDCQVVEQHAVKRYAELDETPGCLIHVQHTVDDA